MLIDEDLELELSDYDLTLRWPRELFLWEAKRISTKSNDSNFSNMVATLFSEAVADEDLPDALDAQGLPGWSGDAQRVLSTVISQSDLLLTSDRRRYYLERVVGLDTTDEQTPLAQEFTNLMEMLTAWNYFPRLMPAECVDDREDHPDVSHLLTRAIHSPVVWPKDFKDGPVSQDVLYSTIEYFHDHARRPRTRWFHSYSGCGYHYGDHNKQSGAAVYRWHVNALLERYGVELKLASSGEEAGLLVMRSGVQLDLLADEMAQVDAGNDRSATVVAEAVRMYRARSASSFQRRAAVTQLAGHLELNRSKFKEVQLSKQDERDLFNIYNNFSLRHNNAAQKSDYSDDYLDWIFWVTLASIQLLDSSNLDAPTNESQL